MKKTISQAIGLSFSLLLIISCGSSGSGKEEMQKKLQEEAKKQMQKEVDKDAQKNKKEEEIASTDGPKEVMSVADATAFLKAADANKGKLVTISAYPKGTMKEGKGKFILLVSDKTGTGLTGENFACSFNEDMMEQVKTHKADNLVKVTGNIAWNNGMIVMKNAKLIE
jgi:hypothetical protein